MIMNAAVRTYWLLALLCLILAILYASCKGESKENELPTTGDAKIIAVFTKRDGTKQIDILLRRIFETIHTDSVTKKKTIVFDTLYGQPFIVKATDSTGKILKAINGQDSLSPNPVYAPINKDSVNTKIENISVDSLLKK